MTTASATRSVNFQVLALAAGVQPRRPRPKRFLSIDLIKMKAVYWYNVRTLYRERKCADTIGTMLVPWAGHFPMDFG